MTQDIDKLVERIEAIPPEYRTEAASTVLPLAKRLEEMEAMIDGEGCPAAERIGALFSRAEKAEAELEAVKAERDVLVLSTGAHITVRAEYLTRAEAAEAERDRLREALQEIAKIGGDGQTPAIVARAALQKEPQP